MKFKVGDMVDWNGMIGEVTELHSDSLNYPLTVEFGCLSYDFTKDGKLYIEQNKPVITLLKREEHPKKPNKSLEDRVLELENVISRMIKENGREL